LRSFTRKRRGFRMTEKSCQFRNGYERRGGYRISLVRDQKAATQVRSGREGGSFDFRRSLRTRVLIRCLIEAVPSASTIGAGTRWNGRNRKERPHPFEAKGWGTRDLAPEERASEPGNELGDY
jgi:hypothetical protein